MFFSLFEQKYISISIHQISVISMIVVSESEGKLVTGEQVVRKPFDEMQMKNSEKYISQDRRNAKLINPFLENKPEDHPVADIFHQLQLGLRFLQSFNRLAALQPLNLFAQLPDFESSIFICCKVFS